MTSHSRQHHPPSNSNTPESTAEHTHPAPLAYARYTVPETLHATTFAAMGTTVEVLVQPAHVREVDEVRALFATWEEALSRFRPESELSRLNARAGEAVAVSPLLLRVLRMALAAARATDGLFDPTMQRQLTWLGYDRTFELVPARQPARTFGVRPGGGWRGITIAARGEEEGGAMVRLPEGVGLDFGGIAKGMAVDASLELLALRGVTCGMVNAGGDLAVIGLPPGQTSWSLAIEDDVDGVPRWPVSLRQGALATSAITRRHWRQGNEERHHLLDPRSGLPAPSALRSVSVSASTCAQAEVAAKVAFLLGEAGVTFLEERQLAGLIVRRDGGVRRVAGWPE